MGFTPAYARARREIGSNAETSVTARLSGHSPVADKGVYIFNEWILPVNIDRAGQC